MRTLPWIGLRQPTATGRSGEGCIATLRAGSVKVLTVTGAAAAFAPNHGVALLPQPRTAGLPAIASTFSRSKSSPAAAPCGPAGAAG